jgi:SAM-dependent methyltransferase
MTDPRSAAQDAVPPFRPAGRFRSAVYGLLWHGCELFRRAASACAYAAAGVLRRQDLETAMLIQFRDFAGSPDEVDEGLNPFEQRVYTQWLRPSGRVLLVGCGAGRDLIGLHRLGYRVTGLEQSPDAAETARRHLARVGITASVNAGSIERAELEHQYDAIVFASSCYSNLRGSALRIATLARLRSHVSPGGCLVISYIGSSASQSRLGIALMRLSTRLAASDWWPEPGDNFARPLGTPGVLYFTHAFRPGDVAQECAAAGFRVVAEEFSSGRADCIVLQVDGD